jgi:protein O-mannosyl-transferase
MLESEKNNFKWSILLLAVVGFCLYFNSLGNGFVWDDKYLIEDNEFIRDFSHIQGIFTHHLFYFSRLPVMHYYRPLQTLTYLLDYQVWKLNPLGYHLVNVSLHVFNAILMFYLVTLVSGRRKLAFLASLIFLIHPLHNAAVAYVSGRADLLVTALMLSSLIFFVKFVISGQSQFGFYSGALILFFIALLTKEISLLLVVWLFLIYSFVNPDSRKAGFRNQLLLISPFLIIGGIFQLHNLIAVEDIFLPPNLSTFSWLKLFTWLKIVFLYLGMIFAPFNLHMERATPIISSLSSSLVPVLLAGAVAIGFMMRKLYRHSRVSFFGLAWFFLSLIPVYFSMYFNSVLYGKHLAIMAEHWLYLPMIGFAVFCASEVEIINARRRSAIKIPVNAALILLLFFYMFQTARMNYVWRDNETLFKNTLKFAPYSYKPYVLLGQFYARQGKTDQAIAVFRQGLIQNPEASQLYLNLGIAFDRKKDGGRAISAYRKAIELNPLNFYALNDLGVMYAVARQMDKAKEEWRKACEANPEFELSHRNLLLAYKNDPAIKKCREQLAKDPSNPELSRQLAEAYFSRGIYPEAMETLHKILAAHPRDGLSYNALGFMSIKLRRFKEAERYFKKAIEVAPDLWEAYNNLASLYATKGRYRQARALWEKVLQAVPDNKVAADNLVKLGKN